MSSVPNRWEARRVEDASSVKALAELLRCVAREPASYSSSKALMQALRSQGGLAKHQDDGAAIRPMSLNHQRRVAEDALGGFSVLDGLRRSARDAVLRQEASAKRGNSRTKDNLLARVKELEIEATFLKQDLAILQRAYDARCVQARHYASRGDEAMKALCEKEQRELDKSFSLRRTATQKPHLVSLDGGLAHDRKGD